MKKIFFHNEAIIRRGNPVQNFFIVINGKANVLNSNGKTIVKSINTGQVYGVVDNLKEKKWKNSVVSENKTEILLISKEILIKKIFFSKEFTNLTLSLLKMAN